MRWEGICGLARIAIYLDDLGGVFCVEGTVWHAGEDRVQRHGNGSGA